MNKYILSLAFATTFSSGVVMADTYKIDPAHTATVFSWTHFGFSTPSANFSDIQGTINIDEKKPSQSSVVVTIPVKSLNTNVVALDKELQQANWFDAAKYPNITFKSTQVQTTDKQHFKISGDLTVKGVTQPVVLNAILNKQGIHPMTKLQTVGFNATTTFDRSAFGLGGFVPNVSDKITVNLTTEASIKP